MMEKRIPSPSAASKSISNDKNPKQRAGSQTMFPGRLYDLLEYVESQNLDHVVSWCCNGTAFMVHDQDELLKLLSFFFGQTKYRSFTRQLSMWFFERETYGPFRGAFHHPYFNKHDKSLCSKMSRHHRPSKSLYQRATNVIPTSTPSTSTSTSVTQTTGSKTSLLLKKDDIAIANMMHQKQKESKKDAPRNSFLSELPMAPKSSHNILSTRMKDMLEGSFALQPSLVASVMPSPAVYPSPSMSASSSQVQGKGTEDINSSHRGTTEIDFFEPLPYQNDPFAIMNSERSHEEEQFFPSLLSPPQPPPPPMSTSNNPRSSTHWNTSSSNRIFPITAPNSNAINSYNMISNNNNTNFDIMEPSPIREYTPANFFPVVPITTSSSAAASLGGATVSTTDNSSNNNNNGNNNNTNTLSSSLTDDDDGLYLLQLLRKG